MKVAYKIWIENKGKAFGEGPYRLLQLIDKEGSLSRAAKALNMSYQKAWVIIKRSEEQLGFSLLERRIGGVSGGGSSVTKAGREFLDSYELFRKESDEMLAELFQKHFGGG